MFGGAFFWLNGILKLHLRVLWDLNKDFTVPVLISSVQHVFLAVFTIWSRWEFSKQSNLPSLCLTILTLVHLSFLIFYRKYQKEIRWHLPTVVLESSIAKSPSSLGIFSTFNVFAGIIDSFIFSPHTKPYELSPFFYIEFFSMLLKPLPLFFSKSYQFYSLSSQRDFTSLSWQHDGSLPGTKFCVDYDLVLEVIFCDFHYIQFVIRESESTAHTQGKGI